MKNVYIALSIAGTVIPLAFFLPWLAAHGLALHLLLSTALAEPVSAFAWADVVVSGLALLVFMAQEHRTRPVPAIWLPVLGLFCVGVSLALPCFLALREAGRERQARP